MQKNSQDFSMEEAARLAQTPAAQQLLAMLRSADQAQLQKAADMASAGDYKAARQIVEQILSTPEIQTLLKKEGR